MTLAATPAEPLLPTSQRGRWLVVGVIALALLLRCGVVVNERSTYQPQTDALHFDHLATSIAAGDGFGETIQPPMIGPTALRAPGYPVVLAAVYVVFGDHSYTMALLLNALLGAAVVAMVGLVGTQLLGRRVGFVAMALAAVHPGMVLIGTSLQLEPMITLLALGALAAALEHRRAPRGLLWPLAAGVLLGAAVLTREQAFFFLPPIAWLLWTADGTRPPWRDRVALRPVAVTALAAFFVVLPWTIRNAVQLDAFVPVTTSAGFGLVGTYNETSEANTVHPGQWITPYEDPRTADVMLALDDPTEVRMDAELRDLTVDIVREHPTYPLRVAFWNTVRGLDLDGGDYTRFIAPYLPYPDWLLTPSIVFGWLVLALATVGAFTRRIRSVPIAIWVIPVTAFAFMIVFLPFSIRYRALLEPFLLFLAASIAVTLYDRSTGAPADDPDPAPPTPGPRRRPPLVAAPPPSG